MYGDNSQKRGTCQLVLQRGRGAEVIQLGFKKSFQTNSNSNSNRTGSFCTDRELSKANVC